MIVAMGTNGNSDWAGWETNAQSYGQQQWVDDPTRYGDRGGRGISERSAARRPAPGS
jgi:hypothetical protein